MKEILSQPEKLEKLIKSKIDAKKLLLCFKELDKHQYRLKKIDKILILACGTSRHAGIFGQYAIEELADIDAETDFAEEFKDRSNIADPDTLVIALSQSGETKDTIEAIESIDGFGGLVLGILNTPKSTIGKMCDIVIDCQMGPEKAVASTKVFSAQVLLLLLIALYFYKLKNNPAVVAEKSVISELRRLPENIRSVLGLRDRIAVLAQYWAQVRHIVLIGNHYSYPIALEGALKIKETAYIHAEGLPAGEMRHGPLALIDKDVLVIFIMPKDRNWKKNLELLDKVKSQTDKVLVLSDEDVSHQPSFTIPTTDEDLLPILMMVALQLFAYYLALYNGRDIDKPRNLSKAVV